LLGAYAPKTEDGTMLGKPPRSSEAAAVPTSAVLTNVRRDSDLLLITAFFLRGISDLC